MTANNPHGDPVPEFDDVPGDTSQEGPWIQSTPICKCNNAADYLKLGDRVAALENKIKELQTRIEWMENYDKEDNPDSNDDSSL